jgi:hypothetical protein
MEPNSATTSILQPQQSENIAYASRRTALLASLTALSLSGVPCQRASASMLPAAADRAWEAFGGGPSDLVYPSAWEGVWYVDSVLVNVGLPQGPDAVDDMAVIRRAQEQDQDRVVSYQTAFLRNNRDQVVCDRRFTTASLMHTYGFGETIDVASGIAWEPENPNSLDMTLQNGFRLSSRVTRRSENDVGDNRLETSEFFQQVIESPGRPAAKVKASQTFTKYLWRSSQEAGNGPEIVATQVVSDYDLGGSSASTPTVVYTYRLAMYRSRSREA